MPIDYSKITDTDIKRTDEVCEHGVNNKESCDDCKENYDYWCDLQTGRKTLNMD